MATFNRGNIIGQSIEHILQQDYEPKERIKFGAEIPPDPLYVGHHQSMIKSKIRYVPSNLM